MPLYAEVVAHQMSDALKHDHLASLLRSRGMTVIDMVEFALAQPDPRALYTMRMSNHPDPAGYRLFGDHLKAELERHLGQRLAAAIGPHT
jgi:hypothetical protein